MILSDIAIRRPVFTVMLTLGLMTLGILGARSLGVDLWPKAEYPVVSVTTVYPGAGPEEVEQLVTKKIEEVIASANGIKELHSYSRESASVIVALFTMETNYEQAIIDVRDKVGAVRLSLPKEIRDPVVARIDPTALPVLTYAVSSRRGAVETRRLVEDVVKPRIESIEGVAGVTIMGGLERELQVQLDSRKLEALGLAIAQIAQQLGNDSFDVPGGRITEGAAEVNVRTLGRFRSVAELEGFVVASLANGSQVRLADIGRVQDTYKEIRTLPLLDGEPAVTFEVQKGGGANTVAIADAVYRAIDDLGRALPEDVRLEKVVDNSTYIRHNIRDVTEAIVFGGIMAILVIFLFMMDWRSTLISSLALPTSIVSTFFVMWLFDFTFNMLTLMGMSLAIGLLIDDAVVVRENIYRHMEEGDDPVTAASRGTAEIGLAVMATTLTIVAVFVPVAFMGGMSGAFFRPFGLTVAGAVMVSLFVSFTLDPMLSARVFRPINKGHHERLLAHRFFGPISRALDRMNDSYRGLLAWALGHRRTVAAGATGLFLASVTLVPLMGQEFIPAGDRGEFRINVEAAAGTSFAELQRLTAEIERAVRNNPEVRRIYTILGVSGDATRASLRIYTSKQNERSVTLQEIEEDLRRRLSVMPGISALVADIPFMESAGMDYPIMLLVRGDSYDELQPLAERTLDIVRSTPGVKDAESTYRPGKPEATIRVDRDRAADLGVSVGVVAQTVRLGLEGDVVAKYREADRDYDIRLQLLAEERTRLTTLSTLTVPATNRRVAAAGANPLAALASLAQGPRLVRIGEIAEIENGAGPATIERMQRQRQIIIRANLAGRPLGDVVNDITAKLDTLDRPPGYIFEFGGQAKTMNEVFHDMLLALAVAVLFIYFVLASQFESFVHPFTIMIALPLAIVGAMLLLFMAGYPNSLVTLIGIVLLMGLVTKNSILLVDLANQLREKGLSITEALLKAGPTRLRPILMTSAAMILGMLPSALARSEGSEVRVGMAVAVIGGVLTSTLLTLVVVPVAYVWMDRFDLRRRKHPVVPAAAPTAAVEDRSVSGAPR